MKRLLKNAILVDGSAAAPFPADILTAGGFIADVGHGLSAAADEIIDLRGLWITPGFIDAHSHEDSIIARPNNGGHKLRQGITTEITGNCGLGYFPLAAGMGEYLKAAGLPDYPGAIADYSEYRRLLGKTPTEHICLVAHGSLRHACGADISQMCERLDRCLNQGAAGLSAGLCYRPGCEARTEELLLLCGVVARHNSIFALHLRDELNIEKSLGEAIEISERSGARLHISHLKALGQHNHGRAREIIERIEAARERGLVITADCYLYTASMTGLSVLEPDIGASLAARGGAEKIFIGRRSLLELAREENTAPEELAARLARNGTTAIFECMLEQDIAEFIKTPWVTLGTDGILRGEQTHPRAFGAFPKYLSYIYETKALSLQTAIQKITALPARIFGLYDRGLIKQGLRADLTVLDLPRVRPLSGFESPCVPPEGIEAVMLGGEWV